jgi:hypothetical protein
MVIATGDLYQLDWARQELAKGTGIIKTAKLTGLGTGTVHKLKRGWGPCDEVSPLPD